MQENNNYTITATFLAPGGTITRNRHVSSSTAQIAIDRYLEDWSAVHDARRHSFPRASYHIFAAGLRPPVTNNRRQPYTPATDLAERWVDIGRSHQNPQPPPPTRPS